jgi:Ni/Co efflux regulator RcnB
MRKEKTMHPFARPGRAAALLLAMLMAAGAGFAQAQGHKPKQALDDRADPRMRTDDVGKGSHLARKPTQPGAYFSDRSREAVHSYYASHPPKGASPGEAKWEIGRKLPSTVERRPVPAQIVRRLPKLPPGHTYVQVAGDILLIATHSKMVVDGISASPR